MVSVHFFAARVEVDRPRFGGPTKVSPAARWSRVSGNHRPRPVPGSWIEEPRPKRTVACSARYHRRIPGPYKRDKLTTCIDLFTVNGESRNNPT